MRWSGGRTQARLDLHKSRQKCEGWCHYSWVGVGGLPLQATRFLCVGAYRADCKSQDQDESWSSQQNYWAANGF